MIKLAILGKNPDGSVNENQRFWIAGNPLLEHALHSGFDDESRSITRLSQKQNGTGFPFQIPVDTANETFTESFKTTLTFDGADAALNAWQWCNSFSRLDPSLWPHPIEGDFIARFEKADGTFVDERIFSGLITKPTFDRKSGTITLSYTLTGGRIEPYHVGSVVYPVATGPVDHTIALKFYGTKVGGDISDAVTVNNNGSTDTFGLSDRVILQGLDSTTSDSVFKEFEVVNPGGSASGGRIAIEHPLTDHLADLAAAYSAETLMSATYVAASGGDRAHVLLKWLPTAPVPADASIIVASSTQGYDAFSTAADTAPTDDVFPVDDNDDIPTADLLS